MIVLPDIHGRTFWKKAVKDRENEEIVFLGDFMDSYEEEFISDEEALENFKEIIEFKKQHQNNVVLLVGNHCLHYFYPAFEKGSRYCRYLSRDIEKLFIENMELFQLAYEKEIAGKRFVFSHSYIHKLWLDDLYGKGRWRKKSIIKRLNKDFRRTLYGLGCALNSVSCYRGGWESYGSMVWADIREIALFQNPNIGDYNIFGHTQLIRPIVTEFKACLDCRRGFLINEEGKICELDGSQVPIDKKPENEKKYKFD